LRALAGRLRDHAGAARVVVGEEPDADVEIEIPTVLSPPRQIERPAGVFRRSVRDGVDPTAIRVRSQGAAGDGFIEGEYSAHLVRGLRGAVEDRARSLIELERLALHEAAR